MSKLATLAKTFFTYKAGKAGLKGIATLSAGRWLWNKWKNRHPNHNTRANPLQENQRAA